MSKQRNQSDMHPIEAALLGALGALVVVRLLFGEGMGMF